MKKVKVWVGCDHAGFDLKQQLMQKFNEIDWSDVGTDRSDVSVDYPDFATKVALAIKDHPDDFGLLICGSGQGMVIKANRSPWVRAALCWSEEAAKLSRAHNNANVLCLAARLVDATTNEKILSTFVTVSFEGGRHQTRVNKL
jgi:ribose 5-phosphate isomerase B